MTANHDTYDYTGSILTPSQRQFLRDGPGKNQTEDSQRMTRLRIRRRLGAAVIDFSRVLTSDHLTVKDIEAGFLDPVDTTFEPIPAKIIEEAVAVLFIGAMARDDRAVESQPDGTLELDGFAETITAGIERGLTRMGRTVVGGETKLEFEADDGDELPEHTELSRLDMDQLDRLHLANEITEAEYIDAVMRKHEAEYLEDSDARG